MNNESYTFNSNTITIENYPFSPASISKNNIINSYNITCANISAFPPELIINNNEIIFIPYEHKDTLLQFCNNNSIPLIKLVDIWSYILEPFLDTKFDKAQKQTTYKILNTHGISKCLCKRIRIKVAIRMYVYNFLSGLWDWSHLGLYDLLYACTGSLTKGILKLSDYNFNQFYWWAMKIALTNQIKEPSQTAYNKA